MAQGEHEELVPAPKAAAEIGVTRRTFSRYDADPNFDFPETLLINRRVYVRRSELEAWKHSRPRRIAKTPPIEARA